MTSAASAGTMKPLRK